MLIVMLLCGNMKGDKLMKTDYVFGDRVKVLPKSDEAMIYSNDIEVGDTGFVLNNNGSTFPVEVQFVGYSEVFMYEELEFLNSNIEDDRYE